ncbi:MAG: hypothetical protein AB8B63_23410 [Granulosicoccus sp.]
MKHRVNRAICGLIITVAYLATSGVHAAERSEASEALTHNTNEFLSDPARTGTIVGSIIAGSAVANPLAPLLGSVAGFMIGKTFGLNQTESNVASRKNYARRNLTPSNGLELPVLAGLPGKTSHSTEHESEHTVILGMPVRSSRENLLEVIEPVERISASALPSLTGPPVRINSVRDTDAWYYQADGTEQSVTLERDGNSLPDFYGSASVDETVDLKKTPEFSHISAMQQLGQKCKSDSADAPISSACYYFFQ